MQNAPAFRLQSTKTEKQVRVCEFLNRTLFLHLSAEFIQRLDMPKAFGFLRGLHAGADRAVHHAVHVHAGSHGCSERPDPLDRHGGAGVLLLLRQDPDRYGLARRRYL